MPVELNYQGSDENAVDVLADLATLPVPAPGSTQNRIRALAASGAVDLSVYAESDRNLIERLAALVGDVYQFLLNDDGSFAALVGASRYETVAPAYLVGELSEASANGVYLALPQAAEVQALPVAGRKKGMQANAINLPVPAGGGGEYRPSILMLFLDEASAVTEMWLLYAQLIDGVNIEVYRESMTGGAPSKALVATVPAADIGSLKLGAYLDSTGDVGFIAKAGAGAQVDSGLVGIPAPVGTASFTFGLGVDWMVGAALPPGTVISHEAVPTAAAITLAFPASTDDVYGAEI